jgi:hypothetical protein
VAVQNAFIHVRELSLIVMAGKASILVRELSVRGDARHEERNGCEDLSTGNLRR